MSKNSKNALHAFLFQLRTPLASIRGFAVLADKNITVSSQFPSEAHEWLSKWVPKVDTWLNKTVELTELCSRSEVEDHDWKILIQQLMSGLEGVEAAAHEAKKIPHLEKNVPGDVLQLIISSIDHVCVEYNAMQELLPTLH